MALRISTEAIRAQIRALEKQASRIEKETSRGLRVVAKAIERHGLSFSELREAFSMSKGKGMQRSRRGGIVAVKYADDNGNRWTGRGRTPLWLVEAEKGGKKREAFLVSTAPRRKAAKKKSSVAPVAAE